MNMKLLSPLSPVVILALLLPAGGMPVKGQSWPAIPAPAASDYAGVTTALQSAPVMFIENAGQFDERTRFQVRGGDHALWLAEDALWITVLEQPEPEARDWRADRALAPSPDLYPPPPGPRQGVNLRLSFVGANPHPRLEPFNRLATHASYFISDDPANWRADVPVWGGVRYVGLYPGVDLEITGENEQMVQRLVVHPGADLSAVRLQVDGADTLTLEGHALHLTTAVGEFALPLLQVAGAFDADLAGPTIVGDQVALPFAPAISNPQSPIANPQPGTSDLLYSTFLGGWSWDDGLDIAVDGSGYAYVAGSTLSYDFPTTPGAFDTTYSFGDMHNAFVAKLDPAGSDLLYATFLGGSDDECNFGGYPFVYCSITVDGNGNAYIAGLTASADFPTTAGALDRTLGGESDVFVTKLNPGGTALVYSTFLGGTRDEYGYAIAVDGDENAYVTGATASLDFPTTPGAYDTTTIGSDAFIVKMNPAGSALLYATFLGGDDDLDSGRAIALDGSGNVYVTGVTWSDDFPTTPGALDRTVGGFSMDAFVTKLNPGGTTLVYSTFLGGTSHEYGNAIAVDRSGAAYVAGHTESSDFPTTPGAFDTTYNGGNADAFVIKLDPTGSDLLYATYLGGVSYDQANAIAVDGSGAAYVAGWTILSTDFPTTPGAFDTSLGNWGDGFVTKLHPGGSTLVYSTFLGGNTSSDGSGDDYADGIAVDRSGNAYVTGATDCSDFPTTVGAFDRTHDSVSDVFVAKLALPSPNVNAYVQAPALVGAPPGGVVAIPIQYGNRGAITATLVTLTATLSSGLSYVSDTSGISPTLSSNTVTWNPADLAFRDSGQFDLRVSLSGTALIGTRYPVTLTISSAGTEDDVDDNTASLEVIAAHHQIYLPLVLRNP